MRGDSVFAICRECHHKMSRAIDMGILGRVALLTSSAFRIPEVKFLQVSASASKYPSVAMFTIFDTKDCV